MYIIRCRIRKVEESDNSMTDSVPFTDEDIELASKTWNMVRGNIRGIGIAVFMEMFAQHPDYHAMFVKFAHIPIERLPDDKVFVNHATIVAKALDDALLALDNLDKAETILRKIGKNHANKNMNELHFAHCNDAVMVVLRNTLKEKFTEQMQQAWNKILPAVAALIGRGLN